MLLHAVSSVATCRRRACPAADNGSESVFHRSLSRACPGEDAFQGCRSAKAYYLRSTRLRSIGLRAPFQFSQVATRVFSKAIEADTYQHEEPSTKSLAPSQKLSNVSFQAAKPDGSGISESVSLSKMPSETHDSLIVKSQKLTERIKDLKTWWISLHTTYKEDLATWGYGTSPIFTVYLGPSGQIEKVSIDEEEIQRRQAGDGVLPEPENSRNKEHAHKNLMLAQSIAKDLELGKKDLNRHSTVFSVVQHPSVYENMSGGKKLLKQIDTVVHTTAPVLSWALMFALPLYGILMIMGAYGLFGKEGEPNIRDEEKSAARLEKMKRLKAQMSTNKGTINAEQHSLAPSELMQKILEVREMARKVRATEVAQKSVENFDIKIEQSEPKLSDPPVPLLSALGGNASAEPEEDLGDEINSHQQETQVMEGTTGREAIQSTLHDVQMTELSMDANNKPFRRVKPRIITSLDEAMAILGSKESHNCDAGKASGDANSRVAHNSHNSSKLIDEAMVSNDWGSHLGDSKMCNEHIQMKANDIPKNGSTGQGGDEKSEVLYKDHDSSLDQPYRRTLHDTGIKRQSTKDEKLKLRLNDVPDNGRWDGRQMSSMNGGDQRRLLLPKDEDSAKDLSEANSRIVTAQDAVNGSALSMEPDEVVGSGQPLQQRAQRGRHGSLFSNTKRWSKELQRKYDLERDPEIRGLMREIGSELDIWVTEKEIEENARLSETIAEGDEEYSQDNYRRVQNKIKEERERFGLDAVLEKYKEYQPEGPDEFWWLDLGYVLCLMIVNKEGAGLYGLDMTIDEDRGRGQTARHVIGFEERKDALNFCRLMELTSGSKLKTADILPFSPKKLLEVSKEEGFKVTVLRSGQIQTHVDQTLEEVEEKILEIGRSVYWEKLDREHSIDIDSILHQRFGL